jgi:glycosyltransferase involved in cell wall biosynthesis
MQTTQAALNAASLKAARKMLYHLAELTGRYWPPLSVEHLARADIYHSPFHPLPKNAKQLPELKRFLTVSDLIAILYPEYFDTTVRRWMVDIINSLGTEEFVLCISQQTKNDLCNHRRDLDPERIFITHLAASDLFHRRDDETRRAQVREKYNIPQEGPYFLSLSTMERRKNVEQVIKCFSRLVHEEGIKDLRLVLVGAQGLGYEGILNAIASFDIPRDSIVLTGYVADEDLAALYSGASGFIYLSLYEGFGLPPLEAMQCGTPVITSNTSSLPEVVGEAGIMVDPTDEDAICQSLLDVYRDAGLRAQMSRDSLDRARQFSWDRCVRETIAAYKTALG